MALTGDEPERTLTIEHEPADEEVEDDSMS